MQCPACQSEARKFGKDRNGNQRFQCLACRKTFSERQTNPLGTMRIGMDKAVKVLQLLLEGMSIRATMRVTGTNRNTILDLLELVGGACERMLTARINKVAVSDVQVDEVWGFVWCKEKTRERQYTGEDGIGDAYCYIGLERDTKLVLAWHLGRRSKEDTHEFAHKLADATAGRFQITTDGYKPYQTAIPAILPNTDFATLVKEYATKDDEHRYSPGEVTGTVKVPRNGHPNRDKICTSHVERGNLTVRMQNRRMTRLTNAFSKKWVNHRLMLAMQFANYNYCRPHMTLTENVGYKQTPAMAAGLETEIWSIQRLIEESTHC